LRESNIPAQAFSLRTAEAGNGVDSKTSGEYKTILAGDPAADVAKLWARLENKFWEHQPARRDHIL
jgi:hypothetical protein